MKYRGTWRVLLFVCALWSLAGCGDSATGPTPGEGPNSAVYDVEYTNNAVVLEGEAATSLLDIDSAAAEYTFDADRLEENGKTLKEGDVFVVAHRAMRKVSSVRREGNRVIVSTEAATVPEVIRNGTISWDFTPDMREGSSISIQGSSHKSGARTAGATEFSFPIVREVTMGDYKYTMKFDGELTNGNIRDVEVNFIVEKKVGEKTSATFTGKGTFSLPRNSSTMIIQDGKLQSFSTYNRGATCEIEISLAAAGAGFGDMDLKLPNAAISIPIRAIPTPGGPIPIPIPVSIDIGIQFVAKLEVSGEASATAKCAFSYSGDGGFEYKGVSIEPKASIGKADLNPSSADAASIFSPVDAQFGVAVPRVSLTIAGSEVAAVFCGFVVGTQLDFGPACKKAYVKITQQGVYDLQVFGVPLVKGEKMFYEKNREAKGEGCP